jgi:hypothetical protein
VHDSQSIRTFLCIHGIECRIARAQDRLSQQVETVARVVPWVTLHDGAPDAL